MQTGQFFPTSNYTNDISLMFDGTHKIYPSRYAVFNTGLSSGLVDRVKNIIDSMPTDCEDYNTIRYSIFPGVIQAPATENNQFVAQNIPGFNKLVGIGDINFLSHDTYGGMIYTETYVNVSPADLKRCVYMAGIEGGTKLPEITTSIFNTENDKKNPGIGPYYNWYAKRTTPTISGVTEEEWIYIGYTNALYKDDNGDVIYPEIVVTPGQTPLDPISTNWYINGILMGPGSLGTYSEYKYEKREDVEFDVVILFYNIYPASADATQEQEAIAIDLPMGIYVLREPQKLIVEDDTLYGSGTSWATRICSRFVSTALLNGNVDINPREEDYNTLAKILTEFGKISSQVGQILNQKTGNLQILKSYLDEFKNKRSINVPYIIGSHWYVNGRDIGAIIPDSTVIDEVVATYMSSENISPELLAAIKGEPGEPGEPGKDGSDGTSPRVASFTYTNDSNQTITEDWWFIGETPICPVNTRVEIIDGEWYINGINQGVQATGDAGVTPQFKIEAVDGVNNWFVSYDGEVTWTCLGVAQGATGEPGVDGIDGSTPYIGEVGGVAYWFIDGVNTWKRVEADAVGIVNNYWYINGVNTGVRALGETGATGPQGETGATGPQGDAGVGISSMKMFYAVTESDGAPSTWSETPAILTADTPYLWTKMLITYTNGTVYETPPVISGVYSTASTNILV